MPFASPVFLFLFVPIVLLLQFLLCKRSRNLFLLIASLIFYAWGEGQFVLLLIASAAVNYIIAAFMSSGFANIRQRGPEAQQNEASARGTAQHERGRRARLLLILGIVLNLGLLISLKYVSTFNLGFSLVGFGTIHVDLSPMHALPGISFFTFSAISYLVDLYRGEAPFDRNPINTALYISFFPKLLAGPIVPYRQMESQVKERSITLDKFASGAQRLVLGLAKKILIADTLARVADQIFLIPSDQLTVSLAWLGIICYTLQIYFDFSGYSDMAIGLGRMAGFDFQENFNFPYISQSIREFWRRWHISLSSWLRNYLYIPMGGNRGRPARVYLNIMIVFFLCGLWHGASWTFVVWGIWHGAFMILEHTGFGDLVARMWSPLRSAYALLVIMIGWVLFRSSTVPYALGYVKAMFGLGHADSAQYFPDMYLSRLVIAVLIAAVVLSLPVSQWLARRKESIADWARARGLRAETAASFAYSLLSFLFLGAILVLSEMNIASASYQGFIYFQF